MLLQARSEFLGYISHELKTPLTLILLYAETLSSDPDLPVEEQRKCIQVVTREGERLKHLIDNLLYLSRIEKAKAEYRMAEGDLGMVVRNTAQVCADWLKQENTEVNIQIASNLPPVIFDQEKVAQTVINLIENARKYGDGKPVDIRLWADGSSVILEVEDHGIGIPDSDREKIFDQFYRGSNAAPQRGSGLGLYLVKETMNAHRGEILLQSEVGEGSRFRLTFPAAALPSS
jgi:two-component system phosphate regulon sensor histidine kinase PhoR